MLTEIWRPGSIALQGHSPLAPSLKAGEHVLGENAYSTASRLIARENDPQPVPTPLTYPLHVSTLLKGGLHLTKKRSENLLQKTKEHEPIVISLHEVRFSTGTVHMAYTAYACPRYLLLYFDDIPRDMSFKVWRGSSNTLLYVSAGTRYGSALSPTF